MKNAKLSRIFKLISHVAAQLELDPTGDTLKKQFWLYAVRYSFQKVAMPRTAIPDGVPSIRDADARCTSYAPRARVCGDYTDCP